MLAEYESWVANMKMKRSHSAICTLKCHKGLRTLGTFRIPEEVHILVRNSILCFEKVWASSQIFLPWVTWQCSRILIWSVAVIFSHFPICSNLQTWEGLEHFLPWRQKKEQSFFSRFTGNNSENVVPSLQWKRPAFEKSCDPGAVLILCFLPVRLWAGVSGGEASGFTLEVPGTVLGTLATRQHYGSCALPIPHVCLRWDTWSCMERSRHWCLHCVISYWHKSDNRQRKNTRTLAQGISRA